MATKKTTKKVKVAEPVIAQITPESIKRIDEKLLSNAVVEDTKGTPAPVKLEDPAYFYNGVVPAGFSKTYGEEVTHVSEGQMAPVIEALAKVFKPEDGFRYFFKYADNFIFTIMVPLKFSTKNEGDEFLTYYRCHMTSAVLRQGDISQQVVNLGNRVAKYIKYQFNR